MRITRFLRSFCLAVLILLSRLSFDAVAAGDSISIITPPELLASPITKTSVDDVIILLQKGFPGTHVSLNNRAARIQLVLPRIAPPHVGASRFATGRRHNLAYPDHSYHWHSTAEKGKVLLSLSTTSHQGVSFALYGLLQEKLGYLFYHPKETVFPSHRRWPLAARFELLAEPRFEKRGFHLHTLHPVELTEQFHRPGPDSLADVKEYVDWLVRNQQNTMQFYLLRGIEREGWIRHARQIVEYAHSRGVLTGVEISLSMVQQQAFQAVKLLLPYPSYRRQIDQTLAWLFQAPWDFVTVERTMGEHLPDLGKIMPETTEYLLKEVKQRYNAKALLATHVIRNRQEPEKGADGHDPLFDPAAGVLLHTVMCYSASELKAPVYGNVNQRFVLERAKGESSNREVWYWPETAYWVAFDNSVPLLLLPYLDSRWSDMAAMEKAGVAGHLTFSSGWEWGYWLFDWSIARWSWRYRDNGILRRTNPLGPLEDILPGPVAGRLFGEALRLQNLYLKERELMAYLSALAPFSELPRYMRRPFQPEPPFTGSWLMHEASDTEVRRVLRGPVRELDAFGDEMEKVAGQLEREAVRRFAGDALRLSLANEFTRGLRVTALRAKHRALVFRAIIATGAKTEARSAVGDPVQLLSQAVLTRTAAQELVRKQEAIYRYPVDHIARQRSGITAYGFGYLYPVSDLFFWRREEGQVRSKRFDPLFMNIWDFWRTLGLKGLFF